MTHGYVRYHQPGTQGDVVTGLAAALLFVGLQLLIRKLEKARRHPGSQ